MKGELNIHIQRVHEKLVVAKCPYCDREFTYKKVLICNKKVSDF